MNKEDAQAEIDALSKQVKNDEKFIDQTQTALDEKTVEWKDRSVLRQGEISVISKAIEILSNDDAKDLMTRSHKSQGYFFLQEGVSQTRRTAAAAAIRKAVSAAGSGTASKRMAAIAALVSSGSHFTEVINSIDKMVTTLKAEEEEDLGTKEDCESSRDKNTRKAVLQSREIDELTDDIT